MDSNYPNFGDRQEKLFYWGPISALYQEGVIPDLVQGMREIQYLGCQIDRCNHHSHGVYAPQGFLVGDEPLIFLGIQWEQAGWGDPTSLEYFQIGDRFLKVRSEAHKHTKIEEICEEDVPPRECLCDGASLRAEEEAIQQEQRVCQREHAHRRRSERVG